MSIKQQVLDFGASLNSKFGGAYQSLGDTEKRLNAARPGFRKRITAILVVAIIFIYWFIPSFPSSGPSGLQNAYKLYDYQTFTSFEHLKSALQVDQTKINLIEDGSIFKVDPQSSWRKPIVFDRITIADRLPLPIKRTKIYTFWEDPSFKMTSDEGDDKKEKSEDSENSERDAEVDSKQLQEEKGILETWKRAVWSAGFEPIVLTFADCHKHPSFKQYLRNEKIKSDVKEKNKRYFAWAAQDAGILSDYRVIPMNRDPEDRTLKFLKESKFDSPAGYEGIGLSLIHADISKLGKFFQTIYDGGDEDQLEATLETDGQDLFAYYSDENVSKMLGGVKKNRKQVDSLIKLHLHQTFLARYPKGITIVDPFLQDQGAFRTPAIRLALALANCPQHSEDSCPPTPSNIAKVDHLTVQRIHLSGTEGICQNSCAQNAKVKLSETLEVPDEDSDKIFSIIAVPHPLSIVSVLERKANINVEVARKRNLRNEWVKGVTSGVITSPAVGPDPRLLFLKDAIYQSPTVSNVLMYNWEEDLTDPEGLTGELLDWQLGLSVSDKLLNSNDQSDSSLNLQISSVVLAAREHVLDPDYDKARISVEAFNPADSEVWKFLRSWSNLQKQLILKLL